MSIDRAVFSCSFLHPSPSIKLFTLLSLNVRHPFRFRSFFLLFYFPMYVCFNGMFRVLPFLLLLLFVFVVVVMEVVVCTFCVPLAKERNSQFLLMYARLVRLAVEEKARCAPFPERNIQSSPVGQSAPQKGPKNEARRSCVDVRCQAIGNVFTSISDQRWEASNATSSIEKL